MDHGHHQFPPLIVGDSYAFVGLEGGVVSGVLTNLGPYPWIEVRVDNVEANTYWVNLERASRLKHLKK